MPKFDNWVCEYVHKLGRQLIRKDRIILNVDNFRHSLPDPMPRNPRDIFDLLLQLILLLLEEWKPDDSEDDKNGTTRFPQLRRRTRDLAKKYVAADVFSLTAEEMADAIMSTVGAYRQRPPETLTLAREGIRVAAHKAAGSLSMQWNLWNEAIRKNLDLHADNGDLTSMAHYLDAWTQIAEGLRDAI